MKLMWLKLGEGLRVRSVEDPSPSLQEGIMQGEYIQREDRTRSMQHREKHIRVKILPKSNRGKKKVDKVVFDIIAHEERMNPLEGDLATLELEKGQRNSCGLSWEKEASGIKISPCPFSRTDIWEMA